MNEFISSFSCASKYQLTMNHYIEDVGLLPICSFTIFLALRRIICIGFLHIDIASDLASVLSIDIDDISALLSLLKSVLLSREERRKRRRRWQKQKKEEIDGEWKPMSLEAVSCYLTNKYTCKLRIIITFEKY